MANPAGLDAQNAQRLAGILDRSPTLATLAEQVRRFADMICHLTGHQLTDWMTAARRTGIAELRSFVAGLERDYDAVHNGLTMPHSSGPVEGHVNRIKMLKRQMFGRANLDLLRIRVLHQT
jgi:transposase